MEKETSIFTFGNPEPVHDNKITDYLGTFFDTYGEYYMPPMSISGLLKVRKANPHHGACLEFRINVLVNEFIENPVLSRRDFKRAAKDFFGCGNAYFQRIENYFGKMLR